MEKKINVKKIRSKRDFYELAKNGLCGNTMRTWGSFREFWIDPYGPGEVGIRQMSAGTAWWARLSHLSDRWTDNEGG